MTEYFDYPYEATTFSRGHTDDCWKWHHECARAEILKLNKLLDLWESYADVSSKITISLRKIVARQQQDLADWLDYFKYYAGKPHGNPDKETPW